MPGVTLETKSLSIWEGFYFLSRRIEEIRFPAFLSCLRLGPLLHTISSALFFQAMLARASLFLSPQKANRTFQSPIRPPAFINFASLAFFFRLFSRGLDNTLLPNCLGAQFYQFYKEAQDHMRTSCRCSGAVGWLVKEPGSLMPLVTSSSAVTYLSFFCPYIMKGYRFRSLLEIYLFFLFFIKEQVRVQNLLWDA